MCLYMIDLVMKCMYVRMYVGHRCMAFGRVMCVTCDMIPSMSSPYMKSLFYLRMYVCMYVCMHSRVYVCGYVHIMYVPVPDRSAAFGR